jgi:predicted small lipoprotein YifL
MHRNPEILGSARADVCADVQSPLKTSAKRLHVERRLAAGALALLLSACGQKGPLYLPTPDNTPAHAAPASTPSSSATPTTTP